jgi:putative flippase GtrA
MMSIITNSKERGRFMRFAVVGVVGFLVDFGTFNLLTGLFAVAGVIAQVVSFVAAVVSNFTWNRLWTYPDSRSKRIRRQLIQFIVVSAIGLAIRTPIFILAERPLSVLFRTLTANIHILPESTSRFLAYNASLIVAVGVVMMWNFFVNRYWTYNDVS